MELTSARWRKSSRSGNAQGHCVEVAAVWRKSSRSGTNGGDGVEVARDRRDAIAVRDSKDPDGRVLAVRRHGWTTFVAATKNGHYGR